MNILGNIKIFILACKITSGKNFKYSYANDVSFVFFFDGCPVTLVLQAIISGFSVVLGDG